MPLSDSKLRALLKGHDKERPIKHIDGRGLHVKAFKGGTVTFYFRYKYNGKDTEAKLGNYNPSGCLTLSEARKKVDQCRAWLSEGRDPKTEMKINRLKIRNAVSVREALEYWIDKYAVSKRANADKHRQQFERHIFPFIGELPLEEVTTSLWLETFEAIRDGLHHRAAPVAAAYIFGNVKQAVVFCRKRKFATSHALDDLVISDAGEKQGKKDRFLSQSELCEVWDWCNDVKGMWYYRQLVKLLISFGARTQEIRLSKVSEWDCEAMIWTCPKAHSKNNKEVIRPIPDRLREYIQSLIVQAKKSGSVYLLGELKQAPAVAAWGGALHKKLGHEKWNLHDLRRTVATHLSDSGIEPHIVESLLGHSLKGVAGIYNRSQYLEQKRSALSLWNSMLEQQEQQSNVVAIKA